MGSEDYLAMKTDHFMSSQELINSDFNDLKLAANKLFHDATKLGGLGFGTSFLKWVASFAAIYLLILDRTYWKTNMLTALLVPYIFFSFPSVLFNFFRGEVGKWISFIAVVLRLFFPRHFLDLLEMPGSLILLLVVSPSFFAHTLKDSLVGIMMSYHRLLPAARAHSGIRWIQKFLHAKPWYIQRTRHHPFVGLSSMGFCSTRPLKHYGSMHAAFEC